MPSPDLDALLAAGAGAPADKWDFTFLHQRMDEVPPPWDYDARARDLLTRASRVVDLGTGSGEQLAKVVAGPPSEAYVCAAEAWAPILPVAAAWVLGDAGIGLVQYAPPRENTDMAPGGTQVPLPFGTATLDLVLARHESFEPEEIARVLRPGGTFLTQQVGSEDATELLREFDVPAAAPFGQAVIVHQLEAAGLTISSTEEASVPARFRDVAGIVFYLRALPWTVPGFEVGSYRDTLARLHDRIAAEGGFTITEHRFLVEARKP